MIIVFHAFFLVLAGFILGLPSISYSQGLPVEYYLKQGKEALDNARLEEAEKFFSTARFRYDISEKSQVITYLDKLGDQYDDTKDYRKAEICYRLAATYLEQDQGPDDLEVAKLLRKLSYIYYNLNGHHILTESLLQRILAIKEKVLGPDHPEVADSLHELGAVVYWQVGLGLAEPLFERALAIREKAFGPDHPKVADSLISFGFNRYWGGYYYEAVSYYTRALAIREKSLGPINIKVENALGGLIRSYYGAKDCKAAKPFIKKMLKNLESRLGPEHDETVEFRKYHSRYQDYCHNPH